MNAECAARVVQRLKSFLNVKFHFVTKYLRDNTQRSSATQHIYCQHFSLDLKFHGKSSIISGFFPPKNLLLQDTDFIVVTVQSCVAIASLIILHNEFFFQPNNGGQKFDFILKMFFFLRIDV